MDNFYILHDSHSLNFRSPFGAVTLGTEVTINIEVENCEGVFLELIHFKGFCESIPMERKTEEEGQDNHTYSAVIKTQDTGLLNYFFTIKRYGETLYYGNNAEGLGGKGCLQKYDPKPFQITVYKDFKVPSWYKEGIIYQIFVDRFCNGNEDGHIDNPKKNSFIYGDWYDEPMYIRNSSGDIERWEFFGGNLQGVINKLPLIKSLGVTTIYLNPIFESPSSHKYDAADYKSIDPMFGNDEKFKELCSKALELNIRVVLDGVFSHTGSDSIYFNRYGNYSELGAYESKESPYYNWYKFRNHPNDYDCWWGFVNQPNVDELNPDYMNFIINDEDSVISKWMSLGASGWRLDVADELPDKFIKALKKKMKEVKEDSVLIGEVWEDASNKVAYDVKREYFFGDELDSVTNYPFRDSVLGFLKGDIDAHNIIRKLMSLYENYPREAFYSSMNTLGTHDTERLLTALQKGKEHKEEGEALLKLAIAFQMTFPGVPLIYYGDEAGLQGGADPKNRKAYPWGRENKEVFNWYKVMTSLRTNHEVFQKGEFKFYDVHKDVLCFERSLENTTALVMINRASQDIFFELHGNKNVQYYKNLIATEEVIENNFGVLRLKLKPLEVKILLNNI